MRDNLLFCASLKDAFASIGMIYPERGMVAEKIVRFSTNGKPNDTAGWCKLFADGVGAVFGCNREGTSYVWQWRDATAPAPSLAERKEAKVKVDALHKQVEIERVAQYARGAADALLIWEKSLEIDTQHDYVKRKKIIPYCARQDADGSITLPIFAGDGELQSLQTIRPNGSKKCLYNGKMKGGRLFIGNPANGSPMTLVEGWATGCSIHEAIGATVVICFSGGNLDDVAGDLRHRYPDSLLYIAGDLDSHGKGVEYVQAASAVGAPAIVHIPIFDDGRDNGDFNDLRQAQGLESVRLQLTQKLGVSRNEVAPFIQPKLPLCDARDGTTTTRPLSDLGNAKRLLDAHGDRLKYVYGAKSWIIWNGSSWSWDDGAGVLASAATLTYKIYSEGCGKIRDAQHFARWARKSQDIRTLNAAVSLLSNDADIRLSWKKIDADPFIIGFNQSTQIINLHDGTVRPAETNDYVTKSLNAATVGNPNKAVRWIQFLHQVFNGDEELIYWIQMFCGYLLTGSTEEHIFLFCYGQGANGKSVFIEILKYILDDYGRAIASETLSESKRQAGGATPDLAALVGVRLVICSETEDNTALSESLLKGLVSGDSMAPRPLYSAPIQFTPSFKLIMAGNHKPIIKGVDNGIWRRVRLVPFNRTFSPEECDPHLPAKLREEAPHILAWMVQGCVNWRTQGLKNTPQAIRHATEEYRVDQDIIGTWLGECTTLDSKESVVTAVLYENYKTWCIQNGHMAYSKTALGRRLTERDFKADKVLGVRCWLGLRLIDPHQGCSVQAYVDRKGR